MKNINNKTIYLELGWSNSSLIFPMENNLSGPKEEKEFIKPSDRCNNE